MATSQVPGESPAEVSSPPSIDAASTASCSGSGDSTSSQARYASYKQYLDENAAEWPELRWMQIFMNTPSGDPDDTRVTVIDSINGEFHRQSVPVMEPSNLWNIIQNRRSDIHTRIILIDYRDSFCIDRTVVDILGESFDIDPLVLQEHLHHEALSADDGFTNEIDYAIPEIRVAHLPSQYRTSVGFNLHFSLQNFTSACVMIMGGNFDNTRSIESTILIWTRVVGQDEDYSGVAGTHPRFSELPRKPPDRRNHMDTSYESIISQWSRDLIALADSDIAQYAAPLISVFLKCHLDRFNNNWDPRLHRIEEPTREDVPYRVLERLEAIDRMRSAVKDLEQFSKAAQAIEICNGSTIQPSPLIDAMRDLDRISRQINNTLAHYDRFKREELSAAQLSEARKSTQTATSVARLTKLAFIFIPLNFVTSFFGMNMSQFGTGVISLWAFFVTAAGLVCFMLIPFHVSQKITTASARLLVAKPTAGFWFFAFCLFHCHETNEKLLVQKFQFWLDQGFTIGRIGGSENEGVYWESRFGWLNTNRSQRFWIRRIVFIMRSVDDL